MASRSWFYYAGTVIVLCLALGGGTMQGLWTDRILQVVLIPALFLGLGRMDDSRWRLGARVLAIATLVLFALQFLPVSRAWPSASSEVSASRFMTVAASRTLESLLVFVPLLSFSLFLSRFSDKDQERLIRFVLVGAFLNLVVGGLQLSSADGGGDASLLPYALSGGMFANPNHFSTMILCVIPLIGYLYLYSRERPLFFLASAAVMIIYLFAAGSRAGMGLSIVVTMITLFLFWRPLRRWRFRWLAIAAVLAAAAFGLATQPDYRAVEGQSRLEMLTLTWRAAVEHLPFGTGIGSFEYVYPIYEAPDRVTDYYVNHAHNDYVELLLETGIAAPLLLAGFMALLLQGMSRTPMARAFSISAFVVCAHSLVDYPARTMAIGVLLALFCAHILSDAPRKGKTGAAN